MSELESLREQVDTLLALVYVDNQFMVALMLSHPEKEILRQAWLHVYSSMVKHDASDPGISKMTDHAKRAIEMRREYWSDMLKNAGL